MQNELIIELVSSVQDTISHEVKEPGCHCIIADKTKDISKWEQIAVVLRYFSNSTTCIYEQFIGFTYASEMDDIALCKHIISALTSLDLQCTYKGLCRTVL